MQHTVYTRCKYDTTEEVVARLLLSRKYTIPAMMAQVGCEPVKWVWFCKPEHEILIRNTLREVGWIGKIGHERSNKEDIQTTLDSDDWVARNWIAEIQKRDEPAFRKPHIIYWHPWRLEHSTGKWFKPPRIASWPSMFYSVYNPSDDVRVYCRRHTQLDKITGLYVKPDPREGFCALVVHGGNIHTTIKSKDIEIPAPLHYR